MKTFVFFYLMNEKKNDEIREAAPYHESYWNNKKLTAYKGGPFADYSGGMITFQEENINDVNQLTSNDPFVTGGLLKDMWIKEWKG